MFFESLKVGEISKMRKVIFISLFISLFFSAPAILAQWNIMEKQMEAFSADPAWQKYTGGNANATFTQGNDYVNFKKTANGQSGYWAWLRPSQPLDALEPGIPYSIEVKAKLQPIGMADDGNGYEANQISLRMKSENLYAPIYLKYGDATTGYVSTTSGGEEPYHLNTMEYQLYRLILLPDHKAYDVYVDGVDEPIFENVPVGEHADENGVYIGAESRHRCNIDVMYVKMGTGAFFSNSKIVSVTADAFCQPAGKEQVVTVTVNTLLVPDGEKVLVSLVDQNENTVVSAIETTVLQDKSITTLHVPAGLSSGSYFIKAAIPDDKIDEVDVQPRKCEYLITAFDFTDKNLVTFGNSITSAEDSWAYQVQRRLGFADLYNGAFSGAIWSKRAREAQNGENICTQDYLDPDFAGMGNGTNTDPYKYQQIINNCAVVHIQKYFAERDKTKLPDYVILSYGTNDGTAEMGDAAAMLRVDDINQLDKYTLAGALRWSIDTLRLEFPEMKIYVALPIQARDGNKNNGNLQKMEVIKQVCDGLSVPYFDCYHECGITQANQAQYLSDGLHPNAAGKVMHGSYIANKLDEAEAGSSSGLKENVVTSMCKVFVSTTMPRIGNSVSVYTPVDGLSLTSCALYDLAGKQFAYVSAKGNKCTFMAPQIPGIYVLVVCMDDQTVQTLKMLVM